jgi:cytochrome c2
MITPAAGSDSRGASDGRGRVLAGLAVLVLVLAALTVGMSAGEGAPPQEGNPFRGRQQFEEKRCATCHSVWGHGGTLGPEISVAVAGKSFYELVGDFWNHTPQMIDQVNKLGYGWPTLDPTEMADILSYLYYLRLFDEPGNAVRGREAYARLQCASCHSLGSRNAAIGRALDRFGQYTSSTALAQAMWNAGPRMQQAQVHTGTPIPQFAGHDMADIQALIRLEGHRPGRYVSVQPLPNPTRGAAVYRSKGCGACHDGGGRVAPDLAQSTLSKTASEITGLLWNHSYAMGARMGEQGMPFPQFSDTEMADLIAHLYFLGYTGKKGDPKTGETVFGRRGCAGCHKEGGAPDLAAIATRTDRAGLASAMWNHAPQMHRTMAERAAFWPKFEPGEMRHLAAYLETLALKPGAKLGTKPGPKPPARPAK